ncbi:vesicular glutamate transporter 2.2-like [Haliotis cracherodii]|uniref:vesicular glutamate transporter 2.2-like n=1 Tax=Haliotis cracherodii TaxID=6455 RepID=UPI0039E9A92A
MTMATNRSDKKIGGEDEDGDVTSGGTLTPGEEARDGDSSKGGTKVSEGQDGKDEDKDEVLGDGESGAGCTCCPVRYCIIALMCIGMVLINAMRTNVGFTVMTILDETAHEKVGTLQALINLQRLGLPNVNWDTRMIGFLHSVFYMGYLITHLPAGYLATRIPCHRLYGGSILLSSALNLLLPVSIDEISFVFTCIIRFLQGLSEGLLYPSCYGILRHWSTPQERGRLGSAVLTGAYAGAVIGFPLAGFITHFIGWQYIYYVNGGAGVLWMLVWVLMSSEKPSHHRLISDSELQYLQKSQGSQVVDFQESWLPWKRIITSPAVISICICHFARNWVFILMLTNEPFYLSLFGFNIAENGMYSSLPHILKVVLSFVSGYIADYLLIKSKLRTGTVRKLLTGIAFGVQTLSFFILTFVWQKVPVIVFLTIGVGFGGLAVSGWQINHYDLSTRHASFLVAVTSTIGVIGAIAAPLVAGELTINEDLDGWRHVFYITIGVVAVAAILFIILGSGEEQPWATPPEHIRLVQKTDPLAKRPYKTYTVQGSKRPVEVKKADDVAAEKDSDNDVVAPAKDDSREGVSVTDEAKSTS